jgi:uncharacterized damage-inducible protein DinB
MFNRPNATNPFIDHIIQIFNYTRSRTLKIVEGLTPEQLDFNFDDKSNSIGTLLKHIGALEFHYQKLLFENRALNDQEKEFWKGAITGQLYLRIVHGNDLNHYLKLLEQVRTDTINMLLQKDDAWLFTPSKFTLSNYMCLFHLAEDEMNHTGQIKITKLRFE